MQTHLTTSILNMLNTWESIANTKKRKRKGKEMKICNCCAKTNKELTILTDINEIEYEICYSCYLYDEEFEFWLKTF